MTSEVAFPLNFVTFTILVALGALWVVMLAAYLDGPTVNARSAGCLMLIALTLALLFVICNIPRVP